MPSPIRAPRREFSGHWALSRTAQKIARALRWAIERPAVLPAPVFALLLLALAWVAARGRWPWVLGLALFMLGDWAMVALLPRAGKSFGPPQPATLVLALPRAAFGLLPLSWAVPLEVAGTALAFYALWIEPHRIETTRQSLRSPKLRPESPLRVLHFGDLHVERITDRERGLVEMAAALHPDLILFSGDLLNTSYARDPDAWNACRRVFERLSASLGVFVVAGSPPADPEDVMPGLMKGLPARWLRDERVTLGGRGQS